jgi:hypothetical protein
MAALILGIIIILVSIFLIVNTWIAHNRYTSVRDRVIIYEAVVTEFAIEPVNPLSYLGRRYRQRRCDITLYIPETDEDVYISTYNSTARNFKVGKHTKIHYFPDSIFNPSYFTRQKVLPFEIYARTIISAVGLTIAYLMITLIGTIMILGALD